MTIRDGNQAWRLPMSIWRYEVETAVNPAVFDVMSVQSSLILIELLKLLLDIVSNRLTTVHIKPYPHNPCWMRIQLIH